MAIRELGDEARLQAVGGILEALKTPPQKAVVGPNRVRYPLELAWLGDEKRFEEAEKVMHPDYRKAWKSLQSLRGYGKAKDEGAFLFEQLAPSALPDEATLWVVLRLADLKERRAADELIRCLQDKGSLLNQPIVDALVTIGGPEIEKGLVKLLGHNDLNGVRHYATEALLRLLGERSLGLSRQIVTQEAYGWKPAAYQAMSRFGSTNDFQLLESVSDYWTGDRTNHYWAMSALRSVRERCNYDLSGPIKITP
jgi:hypothetical protein